LRGKILVEYDSKIHAINEGDMIFCDSRKLGTVEIMEDSEYIYALKRRDRDVAKRNNAEPPTSGREPVGQIIREDRKAMGLSIKNLAKEIGIGAATLQRIEKGLASPSLDLLTKISKRINRPIASFFRRNGQDFEYRKSEELELVETEELSFKVVSPYGLLHPDIVIWHYIAKAGTNFEAGAEEGFDWVYVLKGRIVVKYDDKLHAINSGDMVYCDGRKPHLVKILEESEYIYGYKRLMNHNSDNN
jgi:transcriptional regulator with XRE-family HTH domain